MSALERMKCGSCAKDSSVTPLKDDEVVQHSSQLPLWSLDPNGGRIRRSFVAKNFQCAMDFLQEVGRIAEEEGHHPDLHLTEYRTVTLELWSHSAGGLTLNDFILAAKINSLPVEYSPKWLKEHPEAQGAPVHNT
eukprot:EG_transcript_32067